MTKEAQRIAIAEACGFASITLEQLPTHAALRGIVRGRWKWIPDYLSDLNAMHEAEKVLSDAQLKVMFNYIFTTIPPKHHYWCATAAQRAEAFLRTLNLYTT